MNPVATGAAHRFAAADSPGDSEVLYRAILETAADGFVVVDEHGCVADANPAAAAMLGCRLDEMVDKELASFFSPEDRAANRGVIRRLGSAEASQVLGLPLAVTGLRADGTRFPAELSLTRIPSQLVRYAGHIRDVTDQRRAQTQVELRAAQQAAVAELGRRALLDSEDQELMRLAADRVRELLGARATTILEPRADGIRVRAAVAWPQELQIDAGVEELLSGAQAAGPTVLDPEALPVSWRDEDALVATLTPIPGPAGRPAAFGMSLHGPGRKLDADDLAFLDAVAHVLSGSLTRRRWERERRHQAVHDPLTGLPNRVLLIDRMRHALDRTSRTKRFVGVLYVDLDRFKAINESLGFRAGDDVLKTVARRLQQELRQSDTLARLSSDHFGVLSEDLAGEHDATVTAERLLEALKKPVELDGREVTLSASIGIALAQDAAHSAEALIRDADVAMFRAKERGRGRYEIFDEDMRRRVIERLTVEEGLRAALRTDAFEVFYQPIVSLEDHRIVAVEALVRWIHPTHGIVAPAEFIPVAEESGLIIPIGRRVLLEACRQAARWAADPGIGDFYVSVNLSGRQLAEPGFPEEVTAALHRTGLAPERLALEVTETVLIEKTTSPTATLQRLKDTGVRLLLDDFGTGYSSLNYVKHLPVDAIKVDRSFVASLADGESDRQILAAVASMGKALGIEIVAEGLEDVEQARWLRRLGIALGQGYGFARPAPAAEIEVLLRDGLPVDRLAGALAPLPAWAAAAEPAPGGEADRGTTVTLAEAATALGVSGSTVRRWADTGRLRSVRTRGGHRRFPVAEVRRLSAAVAGTASPALREVPLPSHGLEALATLLESRGDDLVTATSRVLYDARRTGWFAAPSAEEPLGRWVAELAAAARSGDWKRAADATRRLIAQSHHAGSSLAERHGFLERFSEAAIRSLQKEQAEQQVIVETRRLFLNLRRLTLTFPEGRAS